MNDIMSQIYATMLIKQQPGQGAMSYLYSEGGMSLPETPALPETVLASYDTQDMLDKILYNLSKGNMYQPTPATNTTGAINNTNQLLGDYMSDLSLKAGKERLAGAGLKTAGAAARFFTNLAIYGLGMQNANLQYSNTKKQAANEMAALDNQVLYYKNQMTDRFNTLLARNTMTMAEKGLRVSAGNVLEQMKDEAYDTTQDMRTLESNAELKKIALRSQQKQAKIAKELQKSTLTTSLIQSGLQLGMALTTGGGTMSSWGSLFADAGFGGQSGS